MCKFVTQPLKKTTTQSIAKAKIQGGHFKGITTDHFLGLYKHKLSKNFPTFVQVWLEKKMRKDFGKYVKS